MRDSFAKLDGLLAAGGHTGDRGEPAAGVAQQLGLPLADEADAVELLADERTADGLGDVQVLGEHPVVGLDGEGFTRSGATRRAL